MRDRLRCTGKTRDGVGGDSLRAYGPGTGPPGARWSLRVQAFLSGDRLGTAEDTLWASVGTGVCGDRLRASVGTGLVA